MRCATRASNGPNHLGFLRPFRSKTASSALGRTAALRSCWSASLNEHSSSDVMHMHSVWKERSYLQTQWKKADFLDMAMKDWVICSYGARPAPTALLCPPLCFQPLLLPQRCASISRRAPTADRRPSQSWLLVAAGNWLLLPLLRNQRDEMHVEWTGCDHLFGASLVPIATVLSAPSLPTQQMMQPCPLYLHGISLVARRPSLIRAETFRRVLTSTCRCRAAAGMAVEAVTVNRLPTAPSTDLRVALGYPKTSPGGLSKRAGTSLRTCLCTRDIHERQVHFQSLD